MTKKTSLCIRIEQLDLDGDPIAVSTRYYRDPAECNAAWTRAAVALNEPPKSGRRIPFGKAQGKTAAATPQGDSPA